MRACIIALFLIGGCDSDGRDSYSDADGDADGDAGGDADGDADGDGDGDADADGDGDADADCDVVDDRPTILSVDGAREHGAVVVVEGCGFRNHSLDIQWLGGTSGLIETSPVDETPENGDGWRFDQGVITNTVISDDQAHSGDQSLYCDQDEGVYSCTIRYEYSDQIGYDIDIYISWWVRRVHTGEGQWKMFRVCYTNDIQDSSIPQFKMFNWDESNQFFVVAGPGMDATDAHWSMPYPSQDSRWYRMDVEVHTASDHGSRDGTYTVRRYDPEDETAIAEGSLDGAMSFTAHLTRYIVNTPIKRGI